MVNSKLRSVSGLGSLMRYGALGVAGALIIAACSPGTDDLGTGDTGAPPGFAGATTTVVAGQDSTGVQPAPRDVTGTTLPGASGTDATTTTSAGETTTITPTTTTTIAGGTTTTTDPTGNTPPQVTIASPPDGHRFVATWDDLRHTATVNLAASATDADGDVLTVRWSWRDGAAVGASRSARFTPGSYMITVTATDPYGASVSDSVSIAVWVPS